MNDRLDRFRFGDVMEDVSVNCPGCSRILFTLWVVPKPEKKIIEYINIHQHTIYTEEIQ